MLYSFPVSLSVFYLLFFLSIMDVNTYFTFCAVRRKYNLLTYLLTMGQQVKKKRGRVKI